MGGHLDVVQWLYSEFPQTRTSFLLTYTASRGQLDVLRWLWQQASPDWVTYERAIWQSAASSGRVDVLRFLHDECRMRWNSPAMNEFLGLKSDRESIQYAVAQLMPSDTATDIQVLMDNVARSGSIEAMAYLVNDCGYWSRAAFGAAIQGRPDCAMAQWLLRAANERVQRASGGQLTDAIDFGHVHVPALTRFRKMDTAIWLLKNVPEVAVIDDFLDYFFVPPTMIPHTDANLLAAIKKRTNSAAQTNSFFRAVLERHEDVCARSDLFPRVAVETNFVDGFELMQRRGHPAVHSTATRDLIIRHSRNAALMLLWLHGQSGPSYANEAVQWAAKYALVSVLRLISSRLSDSTNRERLRYLCIAVRTGALFGQTEVLQWARSKGCASLGLDEATVFRGLGVVAVRRGHLHVLKWLYENALLPSTGSRCVALEAARFGQVGCLRWALQVLVSDANGKSVAEEARRHAVAGGHMNVVKYLTNAFLPDLKNATGDG